MARAPRANIGNDKSSEGESLALIRQDLINHSKTLSEIIQDAAKTKELLSEFIIDREVRKEVDKNLNEKLTRIESRLDGLASIGKYILFAFLTTLIASVVTFIVKGGLSVPITPT